tara:strand:- start:29 stop:1159 length:1131 start_codon:yes stop_codon:yes gene_type:complete
MTKIGVFSGNRSEYGLLKHLIKAIDLDTDLELQLFLSGSHLSKMYGATIKEVLSDQIEPKALIPLSIDKDPPSSMSYLTGEMIIGFEKILRKFQPDLLILLGDRYETFAAATTAHIMQIPIVHIHGGETTLGAVDDKLRHAISQLSSWHFTSAQAYKQKLISMGIKEKTIFQKGPLIIDGILNCKNLTKKEFEKNINFKFENNNLLVTYHPETLSMDNGIKGLKSLLKAIKELDCNVLFTSPNSDQGSEVILRLILEFVSIKPKKYFFHQSLGQNNYINAMKLFDGVVGNSSSGIVEAPFIRVPVLNIGNRQAGRIRFGKVLDVSSDFNEIKNGLDLLFSNIKLLKTKEDILLNLKSPSLEIINWINSQRKYGFKV